MESPSKTPSTMTPEITPADAVAILDSLGVYPIQDWQENRLARQVATLRQQLLCETERSEEARGQITLLEVGLDDLRHLQERRGKDLS